jgi:hypothetical protein
MVSPLDVFPNSESDMRALAAYVGRGHPRVIACPFAWNTPNLLTGAAVYTPTPGDILLDAWFEIDTAWDGTTPLGDFGNLLNENGKGFFQLVSSFAVRMDWANSDYWGYSVPSSTVALSEVDTLSQAVDGVLVVAGASLHQADISNGSSLLPSKFTAANPIKVVVSQDGTNTGADPGSTVGAAILYLVVATPVTP